MTQPQPEPERSAGAQKPPPLPVSVVSYASPTLPAQTAPTNKPQKVFDTVVGPNLRLKDNLIQLACVIAGGGTGAIVGKLIGGSAGALIGAVAGAFAALLLSGVVIGILRFMGAIKR
ncbi:MAG TPA: hypothetical protein VK797_00565 [Tepidisphaeraceae bacterium]|nr:hypothetical protein [Tepidisphaeraceae bacterium]